MMVLDIPKPKNISSKLKPMLAPEIKGSVFLNPCIKLEERMEILMGPGEMDSVNEKINILKRMENCIVIVF
jgi:hypothetical protein